MKRVIVILLLLVTNSVSSQPLQGRVWQKIEIPMDSLAPAGLFFIDSMRGYFFGYTNYHDDGIMQHGFETKDGGKTWVHRNDRPWTAGMSNSVIAYSGVQEKFLSTSDKRVSFYQRLDQSSDVRVITDTSIIFRSTDNGHTWDSLKSAGKVSTSSSAPSSWFPEIILQHIYSKDNFFVFNFDSSYLYQTTDGGKSFPVRVGDSVFHNTLWLDPTPENLKDSMKDLRAMISLVSRSPFHWTTLVGAVGIDTMDSIQSNHFPPHVFKTLVTTNAGRSWSVHTTPYILDGDYSFIYNNVHSRCCLQYDLDGQKMLYYFPVFHREGSRRLRYSGEGRDDDTVYHLETSAYGGADYYWSSNDGRTWTAVTTPLYKRYRGYEPLSNETVMMTVTRNDMKYLKQYEDAYTIALTTDNGLSWEFDSTTLYNFEQRIDGRIITASDPRHIWIAANDRTLRKTFIFRYDANDQPLDVQPEMFLRGGYGLHYTLNPNPASETVSIELYQYLLINDVTAINILGAEQIVPANINGSRAELDIRNLPIGHYTLRVKHNWGVSVIPLVVMR